MPSKFHGYLCLCAPCLCLLTCLDPPWSMEEVVLKYIQPVIKLGTRIYVLDLGTKIYVIDLLCILLLHFLSGLYFVFWVFFPCKKNAP